MGRLLGRLRGKLFGRLSGECGGGECVGYCGGNDDDVGGGVSDGGCDSNGCGVWQMGRLPAGFCVGRLLGMHLYIEAIRVYKHGDAAGEGEEGLALRLPLPSKLFT